MHWPFVSEGQVKWRVEWQGAMYHRLAVLERERERERVKMVQFNGTYKLEKNENLDEFLSKMDVGFMKRKLALSVKPTVVVEVEGDKWKLVTHTPASTVTWTFTLGAEVTLPTNDGREVRAVFTLEGDKLIQKTLSGKEAEVDNVREFTEDALIMHVTHKQSGVKCTRLFKRT